MTTKVNKVIKYTDSQGVHLVCKGKLVLVKCEPEDSLIFITSEMSGSKVWQSEGQRIRTSGTYYQPIIISEDEHIYKYEKFYASDHKTIHTNNWNQTGPNGETNLKEEFHWYYKILAMPEHFSPRHLQAIEDGKLNNGDEVYVSCTIHSHVQTDTKGGNPETNITYKVEYSGYVKMFRASIDEPVNDIVTQIRQRILDEYRKHPALDWALLAAQKIYKTHIDK